MTADHTRRRPLRTVTVTIVVVAVVLLVVRLMRHARSLLAPVHADPTRVVDEPVPGRDDVVFDARLGYRLPRNATWPVPGGMRHTNDHGFVSATDLGDEIPGPRILWLADELFGGVPDADTASALVQAGLREHNVWQTASVLDATTAGDGLWHEALRARVLVPRYQPAILLTCVHVTDDLSALDDEALPERGELLAQAGAGTGPEAIARMARVCVRHLLQVAPRHGGALLVVLVPDRTLLGAPAGGELRSALDDFRGILDSLHVANLDLTGEWTAADAGTLYLDDGRLGPKGHARVAVAVLARIRRILDVL